MWSSVCGLLFLSRQRWTRWVLWLIWIQCIRRKLLDKYLIKINDYCGIFGICFQKITMLSINKTRYSYIYLIKVRDCYDVFVT